MAGSSDAALHNVSSGRPSSASTPSIDDEARSANLVAGVTAEIQLIYRNVAGKTEPEVARILGLFAGKETELLGKLRRDYGPALSAVRVQELTAEIKKNQRIIFATGMGCNCPGCDGDEADEWCAAEPLRPATQSHFVLPHLFAGLPRKRRLR